MADYYMVMSDGVTDGTATGTKGKYTQAEYDGIGADGFANALSNDWATKGHGTLNEYYYPDISAAITAGATSGDYILCSSTHDKSYATDATVTLAFTATGVFTFVKSVSVTDITAGAVGAKESSIGTGEFRFTGSSSSWGMKYSCPVRFRLLNSSGGQNVLDQCTLISNTTSSQTFFINTDGGSVTLINTYLDVLSPNARFAVDAGSTINWVGGGYILSGATTYVQRLVLNTFVTGGATYNLEGVDLSDIKDTGGMGQILRGVGGNRANDDAINVTLKNCKLSTTTTINDEDFESLNQRVSLFNCGSTSAEAEYQFHIVAFGGEVEDETDIYRNESTAFPSATKVSAKVTTVGNVSKGTPFSFELPARYAEFTQYDKIRIYIASTSTLYSDKVWAELIYRDGTNNHTPVRLSSAPADFLATSVALTTDTGSDWRDGAGAFVGNEYYIELDTSGTPGCDSVPTIILHVGEAAATELYIDTTVEMIT